jgi:hypothetical protein
MAKAKRGLPEDYDLNVDTNSPAILGDFLDEAITKVAAAPPPARKSPSLDPEAGERIPAPEKPEPKETVSVQGASNTSAGNLASAVLHDEKIVPFQRGGYAKPPRLELSLNHETKRMVQEVLSCIHGMGPQPGATTSELFQGIIFVLYRAKEFLDLSSVPRRGQWGSPTAKAFPIALGQAFARAIAEQYSAENTKQSVG